MSRYAEGTKVSIEHSRTEIERTLERFGATGFLSGWDKATHVAMLAFELRGRRVRLRLELPDPNEPAFVYQRVNQSDYRARRSPAQQQKAWEQVCQERWRALALLIKAKIAAVEAGITTLEEVFLHGVLLPDNRTVGEWLGPQIDRTYTSGQMPPLLPMPKREDEA